MAEKIEVITRTSEYAPLFEPTGYQTTNWEGYRLYASDPDKCRECPLRAQCTRSKMGIKQLSRHVWQKDRERIAENRLSEVGKQIYKGRQETVERSFADAKQHHGHRYARYRGLGKVQMQGLLAAACQNMKKIALVQSRKGSKGPTPPNSPADGLVRAIAWSLMPFSWRRWPIGRLVSQ